MIGKKIQDSFNEQIKEELASAYIYLSMAAWFNEAGYDGMAHWMRVQHQEETGHAMKFFDHITERNGRVELLAIDKPKVEWSSALEAWQDAYKHEQYISSRINRLMKLAHAESDFAAEGLLDWFVAEQVEEEDSTRRVVDLLEKMGDSVNGIIMLDRELGKRGA
ncbi:MAG: ferritin [Planctomycetota bacterium]